MAMSTFEDIDTYIIPLEKILTKKVNNINMKEIISLIFHTVKTLSISDESDNSSWKELYTDFETQFQRQNTKGWPKMIIMKNYYDKRLDILLTGDPFLSNKNVLFLLYRLLYIENYKYSKYYDSTYFQSILYYQLKNDNETSVENLSLDEIFDLLKQHLVYFAYIYKNKLHLEYQLVNNIRNQLD